MSTLESFPNVVPSLAPYFGDSLKTVVGEMVKNIMAQLPSKNEEIRRLALDALDATIHTAGEAYYCIITMTKLNFNSVCVSLR